MPRYVPTVDECRAVANSGPLIVPVYRQLLGDRLTPLAAFEILGRDEHAFLLESVIGGEKIGRYSFIATSPSSVATFARGMITIEAPDTPARSFSSTDPLAEFARLLPSAPFRRDPYLPPFTGGLVGFIGYDVARCYEPQKLHNAPPDDRQLPDAVLGLYHDLVIFDHVNKTMKVVSNAIVSTPEQSQRAYDVACSRVDDIVARLSAPAAGGLGEIDPRGASSLPFESNLSRQQFEAGVERAREYIRAGDIFQVVPSQRLRVRSNARPLDVYRALRILNPSPYMFFLKSPACTLIGSSPEILCRVQDGIVTTRPLAGTRPRGASDAEDARLEAELLNDPKERAEHIMLVDLHRNDIGRVCEPGSIKVDNTMTVERYSHVMHITSNVTGRLASGRNAMDALRVSLPVGTVSGAPKIRAMQIIDELEPTRRGPYGGGVGYIDFAGNMDVCIALRTMVWKDGVYDVQAGAGVVADSVPAREYEETINKARAMLRAVDLADAGF